MNEVFRTRLVGLAVLLAALFLLSLLLPKDEALAPSTPATTVSLVEPLAAGGTSAPAAPMSPALEASTPVPSPVPPPAPPVREAPAISALADEVPTVEHASPPPAAHAPATPPIAAAAKRAVAKPEKPQADKPAPAPAKPASAPSRAVAEKSPADKAKPAKPQKAEVLAAAAAAPTSAPAVAAARAPTAGKGQDVPAAAAKAPPASGGWFVQIGSYSDAGNAETIASLVKPLGYRVDEARIVGSGGKTLYRVRLGAFASEAEARQAQQRVARQGYPQSRVVSEPGKKS